jgi:pimeloyl-ACP methyl ester carboxylesterase
MRHLAPAPAGTPTLLIVGDHEVVQAKSAQHIIDAVHERIPGVACMLVKKGGHAVTIDQPEATNRALLEFLLEFLLKE